MLPTIVMTGAPALLASSRGSARAPSLPRAQALQGDPSISHHLIRFAMRRGSMDRPARSTNALARRFLDWRMRRATRIVLNALDDRMLADIGLSRGDIDTALRDLKALGLRA